ncbi:MAG: hypothetical protein ACKO96_26735, partial [Flammeovirgaceae bacterium]
MNSKGRAKKDRQKGRSFFCPIFFLLSPMGKKKWALFFVVLGLTAVLCKPSKQPPTFAETPQVALDLEAIQKRGYL